MSGQARMLDGYIVREQDRAAAQWRASCASDDALRRQIETRLSEGRLPSVHGVSKSHRGTGRPCIVCRRTIGPTDVEREVESQGCPFTRTSVLQPRREESVARRVATGRTRRSRRGSLRQLIPGARTSAPGAPPSKVVVHEHPATTRPHRRSWSSCRQGKVEIAIGMLPRHDLFMRRAGLALGPEGKTKRSRAPNLGGPVTATPSSPLP
jgi:hypothetical protein